MAVSDYNTDPGNNLTISGINIAEGCMPSGINNAIRQMMADVKTEQTARTTAETTLQTSITTLTATVNGKAPISHKSSATTYGVGDASGFGHLKLSDSVYWSGTGSGVAATPSAVKSTWEHADAAVESALSEAKVYADGVAATQAENYAAARSMRPNWSGSTSVAANTVNTAPANGFIVAWIAEDAHPTDGDTVTIDGHEYTFGYWGEDVHLAGVQCFPIQEGKTYRMGGEYAGLYFIPAN